MASPPSNFLLLLYIVFSLASSAATALSHTHDVQTLKAVKSKWKNTPPTWKGSDPCDNHWLGVLCTGSRITSLTLSSMNLAGTLATEIGLLSGLQSLDLSNNKELTGPIPSTLGNLINLTTLVLIGCGFTGHIPHELGYLRELTFLDLSSNRLSGPIPPSVGNLTKLFMLDLANNQLSGGLPVSSLNGSGLDRLINAQHFHLNQNRLSGSIPPDIFHSGMVLIHLLLDSNFLVGEIPSSLSLVPNLVIIKLDGNSFEGPIPTNLGKIMNAAEELHLSNNKLSGTIPDLSGMNKLQYMDLSNNSFDASEALQWLQTLEQLTTLVIENGKLTGQFPSKLLSLPQLETVRLRNNYLNGTLKIDTNGSPQLQLIDLRNNHITDIESTTEEIYTDKLLLRGNPVCKTNSRLAKSKPCTAETREFSSATGLNACSDEFRLNPATCDCAVPFEGELVFRAPSFSALSDDSRMQRLKKSLSTQLHLPKQTVSICSVSFDSYSYLSVRVQFYPPRRKRFFERSEVLKISSALSNKSYVPPPEYGTFYFIANYPYFTDPLESKGLSSKARSGIAAGAAVLAFVIAGAVAYAMRQKMRADKANKLNKPFASWRGSSPDSELPPKVDGVRCFSYRELSKCTDYFSDVHKIGSGGYGTVYKGMLPGGDGDEMVAIKRAKKRPLQGAAEFKNEIELLSRVHHKNLVKLIGFCFDNEHEMLVYEFMPNGSLADNLSGKLGTRLDLRRRIMIALGAARGLAYLHDYANPPIIHRDVKSSNILLDKNMNAKVSDFGLSKLAEKEKGHVTTKAKGTLGYMDPEYYMTYQLSEKSDVYSLGVVFLEIITARQAIEGREYIVPTVKSRLQEKGDVSELLDPFLRGDKSCSENLPCFESFLNLALCCLADSGASRPLMTDVVKELECILNNMEVD